jgi:hypothetical protein
MKRTVRKARVPLELSKDVVRQLSEGNPFGKMGVKAGATICFCTPYTAKCAYTYTCPTVTCATASCQGGCY